jgi:hypothetical protein
VKQKSMKNTLSLLAVLAALVIPGLLPQSAHGMYDPKHGRWLQRDPVGYVDGANLYEYGRSVPVRRVDPDGLWTRNEWSKFKGTATAADCGDSLKRLARLVTLREDDWIIVKQYNSLKGERVEPGTVVSIIPLLRVFEKRLRQNVVDATGEFRANFWRPADGDVERYTFARTDEATVASYFTASDDRPPVADCLGAARLVMARGLIRTIDKGEFDRVFGGVLLLEDRKVTRWGLLPGDWAYFQNDKRYPDKHPEGSFQGQNVIVVSKEGYWGFSEGTKTYKAWIRKLIDEYNFGLDPSEQITQIPGYDQRYTVFFDVPKVAMKLFDDRNKPAGSAPSSSATSSPN